MHLSDIFLLGKEIPKDVEIILGKVIWVFYIMTKVGQNIWLKIELQDESIIKFKVCYTRHVFWFPSWKIVRTVWWDLLEKKYWVELSFWWFKSPKGSIPVKIARRVNKKSVVALVELDWISIQEFNK